MTRYEAPAKLNLALLVDPPRSDGYHPLQSLVQTVEWLDLLDVEESDEDSLVVEGADIDPEQNLVTRALAAIRSHGMVPPLSIHLAKRIPEEAGLGGGSSDAAATLLAASDIGRLPVTVRPEVAPGLGADVPLFLVGGTLLMTGIGELVEPQPPLAGFAVAIAVPEFGLDTGEVYRRWDELEGPSGEALSSGGLPPALRDGIPIRNDLMPAAIDLEPMLADFMADLRAKWGTAVGMTGSGSACFGFFADIDEAEDAGRSVSAICRAGVGARLRARGVARVE